MADRQATIDQLKARFDPQTAQDMDDVFQFNILDDEDYYLEIREGTLDVHQGEHGDPSVSIATDSATLKGIMNGEVSGMHAFMSGKLKASGNVMLATRLPQLFSGS
jgi:putative sterol carrier protein